MAAELEPEYVDYREPSDGLEPFWLHLPRLRRRLAEHGLHLVTDADLRVLGCAGAIERSWLELDAAHPIESNAKRMFAIAELARRGEKP